MEFKGTKGPWELEPDNNWECMINTSDEKHCFEIRNSDIDGFETMMANAKLIATAPDLLKALQEIIDSVKPESVEMTNRGARVGSKGIPSDESIYNSIQAINKALK